MASRPVPPEPGSLPFDAACLGLNAVDSMIRIPRFPRPDEKLKVQFVERHPGGQAATAAVALARWGLRVRYLGSVGDDESGRLALTSLQAEGVETSGCPRVRGAATQQAFVMVDPQGRRTILWHLPEALRLAAFPDPQARWVPLDGHDREAALAAADRARRHGVPVSLDLETPDAELVEACDVVVADRETGLALAGASDPEEAARGLAARGPWLAGLTLGSEGAVGWCEGEVLRAPALDLEVVDTTGAGDIFHAGLIYGLLHGWEPSRSWRFAAAAAGLACRRLGGRSGIGRLEEIHRVAGR